MRTMFTKAFACVALVAMPATLLAQKPDYLTGAPVSVIRDAPFAAEGAVTLKLILFDGTKIEQQTPVKYFRDSMGRVRREQSIVGLSPLNPTSNSQNVVTIVDPVAGYIYTIVAGKQEVQRTPIDPKMPPNFIKDFKKTIPQASAVLPPGFDTREEDLGKKQIDGLMASGRRITTVIPKQFVGNDRPIEVTDERWESTELRVLILSRHHDPRSGDVEYRLGKIKRAEPPKDLFLIPAGYRVVDLSGRLQEQLP